MNRAAPRERDSRTSRRAAHEIVYLVMAHGDPTQALRLMATIRTGSPNSAIYLHHDAKGALPAERTLTALNVKLVQPRINVAWGTFSLVEAVLISMRLILQEIEFRWLVVLSGQDYPLRPFNKIEEDLRESPFDAYVRASPAAEGEYAFRYDHQYWSLPNIRHAYLLPHWASTLVARGRVALNARNGLVRLQPRSRNSSALIGLRAHRKPFSKSFVCYKGSQWFTLSCRAVRILIAHGDTNPQIIDYYHRVLIPDESYFQTILWNSECLTIANDHRRLVLWDDSKLSHPVTLTMAHWHAIINSGKDFGRKFDISVDASVLDALDDLVLSNRRAAAD